MINSPLMRLIPARAWALVVLSAGLQFAIFPIAGAVPLWRTTLCWFALVPFLVVLLGTDRSGRSLSPREASGLGYVCGFLWYMANCYWIYQTMYLYGGLPKPVAFGILILFSLYLGLYHALFAWLIASIRNSPLGIRGAWLIAPFAWVAVELARARITGFPWDLLGYTQVDNLLVTRLGPIAGVMAISFLIAAVNAALSALFLERGRMRWLVPAAALLVVVVLQGVGQGSAPVIEPWGKPYAVMMQENLEVGAVGKAVKPLSQNEELTEFSRLSLRPESGFTVPVGSYPALIIWPEAPAHLQSNDPVFRTKMSELAHAGNTPLIIGSLGVDFNPAAPRGYFLYDSASLFDAGGDYKGRYDKIHLVPWGEYIPFQQFFAFAHKLTEGVGDMDRGHDRTVFSTAGHAYGVFVCYESIFGDEVRQFARNGAEVLVQISDDGWYGDTGAPWQHLNMARMRAIENHRWVLRSTNTGITTAIDPWGRIGSAAPRHVRGAFAFFFGFELASSQTLYTRFGDWFSWLCAAITLAALALNIRRRRA